MFLRAGAAALTVGVLAAAPAQAGEAGRVVEAAAVQLSTHAPASGAEFGYSRVGLDRGSACRAVGAGVRLPADDTRPNPTEARAVPGDPSRGTNAHRPVLDAPGPGAPQWSAECTPGGSAGRASGAAAGGPAYDAAGSASAAFLDPLTGGYAATARSFVTSLTTPAGVVGTVTSFVRVTMPARGEPTVTYRLALYGVDPPGRASAGFDSDGVSVAGDEVPATGIAEQFVREAGELSAALAGLRLALVAPTYVQDGPRYGFTAPAVQFDLAPDGRGVRVCTAAFTGSSLVGRPG